MSATYDENNRHCRECLCPSCIYFYKKQGKCDDGCLECDGESHVADSACYEGEE